MSESEDFEQLSRLDSETDWSPVEFVETDTAILLSLDDACRRLVTDFQEHVYATGLTELTSEDFIQGLGFILAMVARDFEAQRDMKAGEMIQTRGDGLCLTFDEKGRPDDLVSITDESRVRGTFIGLDCLPIPTQYALIADIHDDHSEYKPTLCLIIKETNISELDDSICSYENTVAIPLQLGGVHIDQVAMRTDARE